MRRACVIRSHVRLWRHESFNLFVRTNGACESVYNPRWIYRSWFKRLSRRRSWQSSTRAKPGVNAINSSAARLLCHTRTIGTFEIWVALWHLLREESLFLFPRIVSLCRSPPFRLSSKGCRGLRMSLKLYHNCSSYTFIDTKFNPSRYI